MTKIEEEHKEQIGVAPEWPTNEQFQPRPATHPAMAWWLFHARCAAPHLKLGDINWPMMVRSLVTRVEELEAALEYYATFVVEGGTARKVLRSPTAKGETDETT